ncbi:MAG: hypothetical protein QXH60_02005 [Candidatus Pacearchaeota archaeon]
MKDLLCVCKINETGNFCTNAIVLSELKKKGKQTQDFDLMIASIALAHDMPPCYKKSKTFL